MRLQEGQLDLRSCEPSVILAGFWIHISHLAYIHAGRSSIGASHQDTSYHLEEPVYEVVLLYDNIWIFLDLLRAPGIIYKAFAKLIDKKIRVVSRIIEPCKENIKFCEFVFNVSICH